MPPTPTQLAARRRAALGLGSWISSAVHSASHIGTRRASTPSASPPPTTSSQAQTDALAAQARAAGLVADRRAGRWTMPAQLPPGVSAAAALAVLTATNAGNVLDAAALARLLPPTSASPPTPNTTPTAAIPSAATPPPPPTVIPVSYAAAPSSIPANIAPPPPLAKAATTGNGTALAVLALVLALVLGARP